MTDTQYQAVTPDNVVQINEQLAIIARQIRHAFDRHDYQLGKQLLLDKVLKIAPNHPVGLSDLAFCEHKLGNHQQAYQHLMSAMQLTHPEHLNNLAEIYDILVNICLSLHRREEALYYARLAIRTKKQQAEQLNPTLFDIPTQPATGLHADKSKNIIAYSLFGALPRYCEVAVTNAILAQSLFPQWTCRFYVDDTVPSHVIARLKSHHAQVIEIDKNSIPYSGLFWRFLVLDDADVHCFIIRDADSLLSYKELYAVNAWLNSGKYFHIMRDAYGHSELILAGMWGGYTGIFKNIHQIMCEYFGTLTILNKTIDQHFLRKVIWATVKQSVLTHDNYMLDEQSQIFPDYPLSDIEKIPYFHIGMVDCGSNEITTEVSDRTAQRVEWSLYNDDILICRYQNQVIHEAEKSYIVLHLPYFYSEKIKYEEWYILLHKIS